MRSRSSLTSSLTRRPRRRARRLARAGDGTRMSVWVSVPPRPPLRVLTSVCGACVEILILDSVYEHGGRWSVWDIGRSSIRHEGEGFRSWRSQMKPQIMVLKLFHTGHTGKFLSKKKKMGRNLIWRNPPLKMSHFFIQESQRTRPCESRRVLHQFEMLIPTRQEVPLHRSGLHPWPYPDRPCRLYQDAPYHRHPP